MKEIKLNEGHILEPFFRNSYDSCPEAFIQGVMGRGFCDSSTEPTYGIIQLGEFCYLGGNGEGTLKKNLPSILHNLFKDKPFILVPLSESWDRLFYNNPAYKKEIRYSLLQPELESFDTDKLSSYVNRITQKRTDDFTLKAINENTFHAVKRNEWSRDFTGNFSDYLTFKKQAFGYIIVDKHTGKLCAGASSFSASNDSIEIVIATDKKYQNQGLATAVAAKMILECIKQNKYPRWDAANLTSVSVAEKLGYHFEEEYVCYIPI